MDLNLNSCGKHMNIDICIHLCIPVCIHIQICIDMYEHAYIGLYHIYTNIVLILSSRNFMRLVRLLEEICLVRRSPTYKLVSAAMVISINIMYSIHFISLCTT
jgi:hypothetical protein